MELYIIRHGETVWNADGKLQGTADIALNENGRELAGRLGRTLENTAIDLIYSSPLIRAYETACLIRGYRNIPIIRDDRMREISFGQMEGHLFREMMESEQPCHFFFEEPGRYEPPEDGETLEEVMERTGEFLDEMIQDAVHKEYQRILVVAHGAVNKGLMCHLEGNTKQNYWGDGLQKNCQAAIYEYDGLTWIRKQS